MKVLLFENRELRKHVVDVANISMTGVGTESDVPIEPGIVWFADCVWGHKCGVVIWCKPTGSRYRAGIEFLDLHPSEEDYLKQQIDLTRLSDSSKEPKLEALVNRIKANRDVSINPES